MSNPRSVVVSVYGPEDTTVLQAVKEALVRRICKIAVDNPDPRDVENQFHVKTIGGLPSFEFHHKNFQLGGEVVELSKSFPGNAFRLEEYRDSQLQDGGGDESVVRNGDIAFHRTLRSEVAAKQPVTGNHDRPARTSGRIPNGNK